MILLNQNISIHPDCILPPCSASGALSPLCPSEEPFSSIVLFSSCHQIHNQEVLSTGSYVTNLCFIPSPLPSHLSPSEVRTPLYPAFENVPTDVHSATSFVGFPCSFPACFRSSSQVSALFPKTLACRCPCSTEQLSTSHCICLSIPLPPPISLPVTLCHFPIPYSLARIPFLALSLLDDLPLPIVVTSPGFTKSKHFLELESLVLSSLLVSFASS